MAKTPFRVTVAQRQATAMVVYALALLATTAVLALEGRMSIVLTTTAIVTLSAALITLMLRTRIGPPSPHNVAFIGFRQSGKTTLLVTMLYELLLFRVSKVSARLRGEKTIKQVTNYMEKIKSRRAIGPTARRSQFPYEMNIVQQGFWGRSFKMSFGDFPGERSEEYVTAVLHETSAQYEDSEPYESLGKRSVKEPAFRYAMDEGRALHYAASEAALFDAEFFRWILECDALVFVVDVAQYLKDRARRQEHSGRGPTGETDYAVEVSQAYIRAWSYIVDARGEGGEEREPIVVLAFTKSDLFDVDPQRSEHGGSLEAMMATLGFEEPLPETREISRPKFEDGKRQCDEDFGELIRFLEGQSRTFHSVYTGSLALMDGQRLGVERLFKSVLPTSFQ